MIRVVVRTNPLEDGYVYADVLPGQSLSQILGGRYEKVYAEVNGVTVSSADWDTTYPLDGDFITVILTPKTFGIVEGLLAALAQAMAAAGASAGAVGAVNGLAITMTTNIAFGITAASIVNTAITMGMSMAITALVKPQTPSMKATAPNRFYSLTQGSNSQTPYQVIPKLYGTFRMTPPLAANYYTKIDNDDQYLMGLFCIGYGPIMMATSTGEVIIGDPDVIPGAKPIIQDGKQGGDRIGSNNVTLDGQAIWIGQSSFLNYGNIAVQIGIADAIMRPGKYGKYAGNDNGFKTLYTKIVEEQNLSFELNTSWTDTTQRGSKGLAPGLYPEKSPPSRVVTTKENPSKMSLDLLFPLGFYSQDSVGNKLYNKVELHVQWSREGEKNWHSPTVTWHYGGSGASGAGGTSNDGYVTISNANPNQTNKNNYLDPKWGSPRRVSVQFKINDKTAGQGQRYDIKVTRTKSAGAGGIIKWYDDITWTAMRTYRDVYAWNIADPYLEVDRNVILMAVQVKASGQVNGSLDPVSVAAQSVLKTVNGVDTNGNISYEWKPTSNPAWVYADVLQGFQLDKARRNGDEVINWTRIKDWAEWCDSPYTLIDCSTVTQDPPITDPTVPDPEAPEQPQITVTGTFRFPNGLYAVSNGAIQSSGVRIKPEWSRVGSNTWTALASFDLAGVYANAHTSYHSFTIDDPTAPAGTKYLIRLTRTDTWYREKLTALENSMTLKSLSLKREGEVVETITVGAKMNTKIPWTGDRAFSAYGAWIDEPVAKRAKVEVSTNTSALDLTKPNEPLPPGESSDGTAPRYPMEEGAKFEYNWYHLDDETMLDRLRAVSSTGRASWALIDGQYSIIQDNEFEPVQMFTPRNSRGLEISRSYPKLPDALRVRYVSTANWEQAEKLVLDDWVFVEKEIKVDGDNLLKLVDAFGNVLGDAANREEIMALGYRPAEIFETLETQGVTDRRVKNKVGEGTYLLADQAFREGRYYLAAAHLRTETYNLEVGIDNLVANRGDCVYLANDVMAVGKLFGRIEVVEGNNIVLDQRVENEGLDYSIRVRKDDGSVVVYPVTVSEEFENVVTLSTADPGINPGDLYTFGIADKDVILCKVVHIEYKEDLSATVTMVPAAPEIQCADQGYVVDSWLAGIADDEGGGVSIQSVTAAPQLDALTADYDNPTLVDASTIGVNVTLLWTVFSATDPVQSLLVYYTVDDWETSNTASVSVYDSSYIFPDPFALGTTVRTYAVGITSLGNTTEQSNTLELTINDVGVLPTPKTFQLYPNNWEVSLMWVQPWDLPATDPDYVVKPIQYKGTEVYYSYVNDHTAVDANGDLLIQKLATTDHPYGTHLNLTADVIYYYWIRNVDVSGNPSDFFPNNVDHSGLAGSPTQDVSKYFQLLDDWNGLSGPVYGDLGARLNALEGNL